jgi:hypothetical protein
VSQTEENSELWSLLEIIRFEYLSMSKFHSFIEMISNSFEYFTSPFWRSAISRFSLPVSLDTSNDRIVSAAEQVIEFVPLSSSPLNGVITHLTARCGGNFHGRNIVSITASGKNGSGHAEQNSADLQANSVFTSYSCANSWLCCDFKNMRIMPTHYPIR